MCRQFTVTVSSCGHYRRRRFSHRRVGASTSVKSRAQCGPRPFSRSAHRRDVCPGGRKYRGCARGPTTAARAAVLVSCGCSPGESGVAGLAAAVAGAHEPSPREFAPFAAAGVARAGGSAEQRLTTRRAASGRGGVRGGFGVSELEPAWRTPGRTARDWAGPQLRPFTLPKSGNCTALVSANPKSPAARRSAAPRYAGF